MFYVYCWKSLVENYHYIGHTNNVQRRFREHNRNRKKDWLKPIELIYVEAGFNTRGEAMKKEYYYKRKRYMMKKNVGDKW